MSPLFSPPGRYTWWDYRAGNFHKNIGMRIDHLLVTTSLQHRVVWAEIDREARKGKPLPSDHAPVVIDLDSPSHPFDAGRASAESRIAAALGETVMSHGVGQPLIHSPNNDSQLLAYFAACGCPGFRTYQPT
jgi:hypothetical protein